MSHFFIMVFHALLVGTFFAFLVKTRSRDRWRMFLLIVSCMVLGALALAWILYPFPVQGTQ
ncbi:MAG: hypothetical protein ACE5ID_00330 [Acidobacteriota bacterium]